MSQQEQGQQGNGTDIAWGIAFLFAAILGIWYGFKKQLVSAVLFIKYYEALLLSYLFGILWVGSIPMQIKALK